MRQQLQHDSAKQKIDELITEPGRLEGKRLAEVRRLVHNALPEVVETWKWMGSPVWEQNGIIAVANAHKAKIKLTFPQGAQLTDADHLFNAGLSGKAWRAIDLHEHDTLDPTAFQTLIQQAAAHNAASSQ